MGREAPMYTDARQKHVTVPSLSVGDTVDYDVVLTSQPLLPGQFWHTTFFMATAIFVHRVVAEDKLAGFLQPGRRLHSKPSVKFLRAGAVISNADRDG